MLRLPARLALALGTLTAGSMALLAAPARGQRADAPTVRVVNHHEFAYAGPVTFRTTLPDGAYRSAGAHATVRGGLGRATVTLAPGGSVTLARTGASARAATGPLRVAADGAVLVARLGGREAARVAFGLAVRPGRAGTADDAAARFVPLALRWTAGPGGTLRASGTADGYKLDIEAVPDAGGPDAGGPGTGSWLDATTTLTRLPGTPDTAYVALVRRVEAAGDAGGPARLRWNGAHLDSTASPDTWDRDFWYVRGLDYAAWSTPGAALAVVNGFTPGPARLRGNGAWAEGSHFYVWERALTRGAVRFFVSEVAGPNPEQAKSSYMPISPYAAPPAGRPVVAKSRLALRSGPLGAADAEAWAESQLHGFAGYRSVAHAGNAATVGIGVDAVRFGVSYFPYSTFAENFGFFRTPGLDRETWWPTSPVQWAGWRGYNDRTRGDLRIIRSLGFTSVRLHHLELLRAMPEADALAYLDFFAGECRALGLTILADTEGPAEWVALIAGRYRDVLDRIEIENEILIPGIPEAAPARWTALYRAAKAAAPETDVFLTGVGNHGMFVRLQELGVPFDRVGIHAYKHGPQLPESFSSHMLGSGGVAADFGLPITLGEFNWKSYTRLSAGERRRRVAELYDAVLTPRAVPEVHLFHFGETISVNPTVAQNGTRHYEIVGLDRRPKPEMAEFAARIRRFGPADAPVNELPIEVAEGRVEGGRARLAFRATNRTAGPLALRFAPECFGFTCALEGASSATLAPGASATGTLVVTLADTARVGLYHGFVRADYAAPGASARRTAYGWGRATLEGRPRFEAAPRLPAQVVYEGGPGIVDALDFTGSVAVVYGADAPVLELETAFLVASTLQAATGRSVLPVASDVLTDSMRAGTLVVVGTAAENALVGAAPEGAGGRGVVRLDRSGSRPALVLTGRTSRAAFAAAMDVVLRFWPHAEYAAARLTGLEPNPALPPDRIPENDDTDRVGAGAPKDR